MVTGEYYEGLNEKLLMAIPSSKKILEFGCGRGRLGQRYKELHPATRWHGIDIHAASLEVAATRLDRVWTVDLDDADIGSFEDGYDCVVMGDVLEHLRTPERLLIALEQITITDAKLVCCVPNMTHISIAERILAGDLTYDDNGLMDRTHLRSSLRVQYSNCSWIVDGCHTSRIHIQYLTRMHYSPKD